MIDLTGDLSACLFACSSLCFSVTVCFPVLTFGTCKML